MRPAAQTNEGWRGGGAGGQEIAELAAGRRLGGRGDGTVDRTGLLEPLHLSLSAVLC